MQQIGGACMASVVHLHACCTGGIHLYTPWPAAGAVVTPGERWGAYMLLTDSRARLRNAAHWPSMRRLSVCTVSQCIPQANGCTGRVADRELLIARPAPRRMRHPRALEALCTGLQSPPIMIQHPSA
jgi:hypothetical protein